MAHNHFTSATCPGRAAFARRHALDYARECARLVAEWRERGAA